MVTSVLKPIIIMLLKISWIHNTLMYKNRILIVEDEALVGKHLKNVLLGRNYEIAGIFSNGEETIEFIKHDRPDLVLMDIWLNGKLDGIETAELIKGLFDIPIIYLTAYSDDKTLTRAKITEPFGYIVKPFEEKELYGTIEMALFKYSAERKLKESEERYKALLNNSFYLVLVLDYEGNIIDANPAALKLIDISHYEVNSLNISEFIPPDDIKTIYRLIDELKDKKLKTEITEVDIKSRDGKIYSLEINAALVYKNSQPVAVQIIGRDITQKKRTEKELIKSEFKYRALIERMNEGVIQVNNNDVIEFVNSRFCTMVGFKPEEILGKTSLEIFALPEDRDLIKQKNRERLVRKTDKYELQYKKKNGDLIWVEISASPVIDENENVTGSFALLTDITDRRKADSAISHLAAIVESSEDAIISKTLEGEIISWNKGAELIYGYSQEEILGKHISTLAPPEKREELDIIMNKLKNGFRIDNFETVHLKKDGTLFFVSLTISPIINSFGEIISVSSIARDISEYKKALDIIKESEQKYKDIVEFAPAGIFQVDNEGNLITANTAFMQILDCESADLLTNLNLAKEVFVESEYYYHLSEQTSITGAPIDTEIQWKKFNGDVIWIQLNFRQVKNGNKAATYFEGFVRDVTSHRFAEQELIEREQSYRTLIETSIDAIYVLQGRQLLLVNNEWERIFGYSSYEATSPDFNIMKIVAPESTEDIERRFNRQRTNSITSPISSRYEMTGISKYGKRIQLEVSASEILWKGKPVVQGIYRDITERKKAEAQIRMLSMAVKQSSASIIITDTKGKIEYVNQKFSSVTGYSYEEVIRKTPAILASGNLNHQERQLIRSLISSGKEWKGEFLNKKKNGEFYWESATISPIFDENGKITHYLSVQEDITLRKKQEQQLIIAKENAEKSDKLKTEFLAQMSHEIRTPLNNILTYTSVLKEEFEDKLPEGLESTFQVIDSSSLRLIRTIELILNLSRIQTGNFEANFEKLDLEKDLLEDILLEFYSKAKKKGVALNFKNKAKDSIIYADKYSMGQVFINIIDNALKYTDEGAIDILIYNNAGKAHVEIQDTGIGIASEYISELFNPFTQEDMGMTRHFEGIGLGLALVKKYAEVNNAQIQVQSAKGKGSTFTISMKNFKMIL